MSLNSKILKTKLVEFIKNNPNCVKNLFDLQDRTNIDEAELCKIGVWKRTDKQKDGDKIYRYFSPYGSKQESLSDQVTAEIITDGDDLNVLSIIVEG